MRHITLVIFLAFLLAACATAPPPALEPPSCADLGLPDGHEHCLSYQRVWLLLNSNSTGFDHSWNNQDTFLRPYRNDAYGPGIHSDATGRPFRWQTEDGQLVPPGNRVRPDAYGLGVGMDEFGRPVKPSSEW
jgi:hypothetical protein